MVLDASDYQIPRPGETWNPMNVRDFVTRAAGAIFVFTLLLYLFNFASNRGLPLMDSLMSNVGLSSSGGDVPEFP